MVYGLTKKVSRKFSTAGIKNRELNLRRAETKVRDTNNVVERAHGALKDTLKLF